MKSSRVLRTESDTSNIKSLQLYDDFRCNVCESMFRRACMHSKNFTDEVFIIVHDCNDRIQSKMRIARRAK